MNTLKTLSISVILAGLSSMAFAQTYAMRVASPGLVAAAAPAPAEPPPPARATVVGGSWSDGTYAESCLGYLTGDATHTPGTTNGVYIIKPAQATYSVTCDMTGGGWTRFDYLVPGIMPWPGNSRNIVTSRVPDSYLAMYKEIASVSTLQTITANGISEYWDRYSFLDLSGVMLPGTELYYNSLQKDIQINVARDWRKAFGSTRFTTDGSHSEGAGGGVAAYTWFK